MAENVILNGADVPSIKKELREMIERRVSTRGASDDFLEGIASAVDRSTIIPTSDEKYKLIKETDTRLILTKTEIALKNRDYDSFIKEMKWLHEQGDLKFIWKEWEYRDQLKQTIRIMEMNAGEYCREQDPAVPGPHRMAVDAYLATIGNLEDQKVVKEMAERLMKISGMWTRYTGPLDRVGPPPRLLEDLILDNCDSSTPGLSGKQKYVGNALYHEQWEAEMTKAEVFFEAARKSHAPPPKLFPAGDPVGLRGLLQLPAEFVNSSIGRADALRPKMKTYMTSLPVSNGFRTMEDYLDNYCNGTINPQVELSIVHWAQGLKEAHETRTAAMSFVNDPFRDPFDPKSPEKSIESLINMTDKQHTYLERITTHGVFDGQYYAAKDRILDLIDWLNGKSDDRKKEFGRLSTVGPQTKGLLIKTQDKFTNTAQLEEILRKANASRTMEITREGGSIISDASLDVGTGLLTTILKGLGLKI